MSAALIDRSSAELLSPFDPRDALDIAVVLKNAASGVSDILAAFRRLVAVAAVACRFQFHETAVLIFFSQISYVSI